MTSDRGSIKDLINTPEYPNISYTSSSKIANQVANNLLSSKIDYRLELLYKQCDGDPKMMQGFGIITAKNINNKKNICELRKIVNEIKANSPQIKELINEYSLLFPPPEGKEKILQKVMQNIKIAKVIKKSIFRRVS